MRTWYLLFIEGVKRLDLHEIQQRTKCIITWRGIMKLRYLNVMTLTKRNQAHRQPEFKKQQWCQSSAKGSYALVATEKKDNQIGSHTKNCKNPHYHCLLNNNIRLFITTDQEMKSLLYSHIHCSTLFQSLSGDAVSSLRFQKTSASRTMNNGAA